MATSVPTTPSFLRLNPCAQEFVPKAIQQHNQDYPVLVKKNKKQLKNGKNLNFAKAVKHREKVIVPEPEPEPFPNLDPSWVVLKPENRTKENRKVEEVVPFQLQPETTQPPSPQHTIFVSEKPSVGAIDRWKGRWMQIARTVRENLKSQSLQHETNHPKGPKTKTKGNKTNSLWHNALSLPSHLYQVEFQAAQQFPIHMASQSLKSEEDLLSMNSDLPRSSEEWWFAVQNGDISTLLSVISHPPADFDWKNSALQVSISGDSAGNIKEVKMGPLHAAVYFNQSSSVKLLLDLGMNIEIRDTLKRTPLLVAAECGYLDIIQLLVDYGADLTAKDKDMNSLLHCACYLGNRFKSDRRPSRNIEFVKVVQWLSEKSKSKAFSINWKNKQRNTPLLVAIETGNVDIVSTLLHAGADPCSINIYREDGLAIAAKRGNSQILELLLCTNSRGQSRGVSSLNRSQKTSDKTLFPVSPLNVAAKIGSLESIQLLISHGISINSYDDYQFQYKGIKFYALTPLMIASILGHTDIVAYLVSPEVATNYGQQLQINITDRNGLTALGCACLFGHLDCLELIARWYPESLSFSYRYHDFESVPESVVRNMMSLSPEDRQETLHCLAHLITRGSPLTEKLIRRLVGRKFESESGVSQENVKSKGWNLSSLGCPDVSVTVIGNKNQPCEIMCHSFILQLHSDTFKVMLQSPLTTQRDEKFVLSFPHISEKVFQLMLSWMYSGQDVTADPEVKCSSDLLIELMITANEFFILRLQRICEQRISQCIQTHLLTDESVNQIKELATLLHLDHLLVSLTHESSNTQPLESIHHLQNQSLDVKDLNLPLEPRMFPHLCYLESSPQQNSYFEIDFLYLRQILFLRLRSMNSNLDSLRYEKLLCDLDLKEMPKLSTFSLKRFLLSVYSISNSPQTPLEDSSIWNDLLCDNRSFNRLSQSNYLPVLCRLLLTCFSSLFDFCLFSWECLQATNQQREFVDFLGFQTKHLYSTTLPDFLSHEMYALICQHLILSQTGYRSSSSSPPPLSQSLSRGNLSVECEAQRIRYLHESIIKGRLVKIDSLVRLYSNQQNHFQLWNHHLSLADLNANDLDDMLCFSYLGYLPIPQYRHSSNGELEKEIDERWVDLQEMNPRVAHLINLLILADEYLMDSLKKRVEGLLIHDISPESCACLFSVASSVNAIALRDAAAISFLSNFKLFSTETSLSNFQPPSSDEQESNSESPSARISLFFDESIEIRDFLHYILTSFL